MIVRLYSELVDGPNSPRYYGPPERATNCGHCGRRFINPNNHVVTIGVMCGVSSEQIKGQLPVVDGFHKRCLAIKLSKTGMLSEFMDVSGNVNYDDEKYL